MPERAGHTPHDGDGDQIGTFVADDIVRSINISYRGSIPVHTYVLSCLIHPTVPRSIQDSKAKLPSENKIGV
ncbi:hypothetical protein FRC02_005783 [Tulasnella sp. 418]|nr:hypothetical protein FRC02_005783 [Tulasnella sp. 418]